MSTAPASRSVGFYGLLSPTAAEGIVSAPQQKQWVLPVPPESEPALFSTDDRVSGTEGASENAADGAMPRPEPKSGRVEVPKHYGSGGVDGDTTAKDRVHGKASWASGKSWENPSGAESMLVAPAEDRQKAQNPGQNGAAPSSSIRALAGVEVEASFWPDDRDWQIYYTDVGIPLAMAPIDQVGRRVDDGSPVFAVGEERTLLDAAAELGLELRELLRQLDVIWQDFLMEPFA